MAIELELLMQVLVPMAISSELAEATSALLPMPVLLLRVLLFARRRIKKSPGAFAAGDRAYKQKNRTHLLLYSEGKVSLLNVLPKNRHRSFQIRYLTAVFFPATHNHATMPTAAKVNLYLTGILSIMILLLGLSFLGAPFTLKIFGLTQISTTLFLIERLSYWLALILLWLYAVRVEKGPLLLWRQNKYPLFGNIVACCLIVSALLAGSFLLQAVLRVAGHDAKSTAMTHLMDLLRNKMPLLIFTAVTAGIVEELIFRGYVQPRLEEIFRNPYVAIIVSSLLFGLLHYRYGTLIQVIGPTYIGMIFAIYYWKYRNITVIIVCHFGWDLMSLLIATR